ncbi:unnamed protein product [Strongylus vulgaris]|uniref:Uncharacterized protein n=1 Tax=Strongylus vulgaris TaxID=40348 RepID=A0A3P7J4R5_STRVU|nr:unnamed protein product [Strongylus vulgaris]
MEEGYRQRNDPDDDDGYPLLAPLSVGGCDDPAVAHRLPQPSTPPRFASPRIATHHLIVVLCVCECVSVQTPKCRRRPVLAHPAHLSATANRSRLHILTTRPGNLTKEYSKHL